jgi:hypothetical protein
MSELPLYAIGIRLGRLVALLGAILAGGSQIQASEPLRIQAEVGSGPYYVGQGFELRVTVIAAGRPKIDPPRIDGALAWAIGTEREPLTATGIGSIVDAESRFVVRFRVVARRSGSLEIPSMQALHRDRSGRSRPLRVPIQPMPLMDRPAAFLGGVGRFELHAEATPNVVRVGQEMSFRIKVTGPAAWGMTGRPELASYDHLGLGLRIEPEPDEMTNEPPARTFVYRLRPTRAGEAVLPPVAIAAFDPATRRFATHVTAGVPIRAVAVASFDATTLEDGWASRVPHETNWQAWSARGLALGLLLLGYAMVFVVRVRMRRKERHGLAAARRYAAQVADGLESAVCSDGDTELGAIPTVDGGSQPAREARRVSEELVQYLRLGTGRPPAALTPVEARLGVAELTGSEALGAEAARLAARCDLALYGDTGGTRDGLEVLATARALFQALGRVKSRRRGAG